MRAQASYTITAVKDGNDLDSILMLWAKTTTNAAPSKPNGTNLNGWTEEMPEFESGAYVWTCNRVAISDPTAATPIYTYTDPVLDTHWKKLDELNKQGTEIKDLADKVVIRYYNTLGAETSFTLSDGELDLSFLKGQIDDAEKVATNFISMRGDGGIEVGNKSGGSWTGYRSQMLASEFNILNSAGKKVASYGASEIGFFDSNAAQIASFKPDMICLGMSGTTDTAIDFNNGMATLRYDVSHERAELESDSIAISSYSGGDVILYSQKRTQDGYFVSTNHGQIYVNSNGAHMTGGSGDDYSVDLYTGINLGSDGVGRWESWGTDSDGYPITCSIEVAPFKLQIRGQSTAGNWFNGRNGALLATTNTPENAGYAYPFLSAKSYTGSWDVLTIGNVLYFNYVSDSNYNAGSSDTVPIEFRANGSIKNPGYIWPQKGVYLPYGVPLYVTDNDGSEHSVIMSVYAGSTDHVIFGNMQYAHLSVLIGNTTEIRANKNINIYPYYSQGYGGIVCGAQSTDRGIELKPSSNNTCSLGWSSGRWKYLYVNKIYTTNSVSVDSDKRLKKDISYDFSSLDKVIDLIKPATYKLIADDEELIRFGFIAQDAEQAFIDAGLNPDDYAFISKDETENGVMLSLGYTETNALLWHRQQQLEQRIAELEKRIA